MRVLAIETSSRIGSFAIVEEESIVCEVSLDITSKHVERGVSMVEEILNLSSLKIEQIDAVGVSIGPGSFTGLRVGLSVAKGICFASDKPLVPVPTLDCLVYVVSYWDGIVVPVRDARRGEVYCGVYRTCDGTYELLEGYLSSTPQSLCEKLKSYRESVLLVGDGIQPYRDVFVSKLGKSCEFAHRLLWNVRASVVGVIAKKLFNEGVRADLDSVEPLYVRPSEAERQDKGTTYG